MSSETSFKAPKSAAVIGLGYVGLPTAALLAGAGVQTLGVDINQELLQSLDSGTFKPKEPGLFELVSEAKSLKTLKFSDALEPSDAYIIAVPTPINEDKTPRMDYVLSAARSIAKVLQAGQLVILESTSPPGSTEMVAQQIKELRPDLDTTGKGSDSVKFAYCPERVLPGNALHEIVNNERLVGGLTEESALMAQSLYSMFTKGNIVICSDREAEMAKLVENSFRDVNIAFANEVARIATTLGVQARKVIELANRHPRVNILSPGVGVGGHCISVDPWFLIDSAPDVSSLIKSARKVNDGQPLLMASEIANLAKATEIRRIVCLGLSYKPNSDDLRESPSITLVRKLIDEVDSLPILVLEPNVRESEVTRLFGEKVKTFSPEENLTSSDLVVELVDHDYFKQIDLGESLVVRIHGRGQANHGRN
ncbi:MAG: nucleotide sugar dehydrogenase [Actinobacteria bacterium]|nr:nucleotide sugar dehydrogenase [Actinomycetota bacterium]